MRKMAGFGCNPQPLRYVSATVVHLQKKTALVARLRSHASMPDIRHKQAHVARLSKEGRNADATVGQIVVEEPISGGCLTGQM